MEAELRALREQLAASEAAQAASEAARAAEHATRMKSDERNAGTFYSTIGEMWGTDSVAFNERDFDALFRQTCPKLYLGTFRAAMDAKNTAADESSASRSSKTPQKKQPTDIFGNKNYGAEVAHLIPAAPSDADTYDHVVSWVTGYRQGSFAACRKAIHGSRLPPEPSNKVPKRMNLTGLKHANENKMRLAGQCEYMDTRPCVVVVPAMTLEDMLNWEMGNPYTAIVMVDDWEPAEMTAEQVARFIGIGYIDNQTEAETEATNDEIEQARLSMSQVLKGLAYSLSLRSEQFRKTHKLFNIAGQITVPRRAEPAAHRLRVRKVTFGLAGRHPAPDPLLLAIRSALVWSARNNERLVTAGGAQDDDDDNSSIESEEECVEGTMVKRPQQREWLLENVPP